MTRGAQLKAVLAVAVLAGAIWAWQALRPSDERAIRRQLDALANIVNQAAPEGLGSVTRATQIGSFFTRDVVIDLGAGSTPIQGRDAVIGLAARLPPGAGGYVLEFDDVEVTVGPEAADAQVGLAATLTRRNPSTGERSTDARELQLTMRKLDDAWRITRVTAVDTLRRE